MAAGRRLEEVPPRYDVPISVYVCLAMKPGSSTGTRRNPHSVSKGLSSNEIPRKFSSIAWVALEGG
jgi:hypothetical protein